MKACNHDKRPEEGEEVMSLDRRRRNTSTRRVVEKQDQVPQEGVKPLP